MKSPDSPNGEALLSVQHLQKILGPRVVLNDVCFEVARGELIGLVGANGAGKTTLLRCISGQLVATSGQTLINGISVTANPVQAKRAIGFAIEPELLPGNLTGLQLLEFVAGAKRSPNWRDEVMPIVESLDLVHRLGDQVAVYSHGMKQKVGILSALIAQPSLLILDESLSALDPVSAFRLKHHLALGVSQKKWSVLLSSHAIEMVERVATRIIMLQEGTVRLDWTREQIETACSESGLTLEELLVRRITQS